MNAIAFPSLTLFFLLTHCFAPCFSMPTERSPLLGQTQQQLDSLARHLGQQLSKVTTPEVEQRKLARTGLQRKGYEDVLLELLRGDSLGSILSFFKMTMQIEIFLPHNTVYVYQQLDSIYLAVPLAFKYEDGTELIFETKQVKLAVREDWTFPVDPWKKGRK